MIVQVVKFLQIIYRLLYDLVTIVINLLFHKQEDCCTYENITDITFTLPFGIPIIKENSIRVAYYKLCNSENFRVNEIYYLTTNELEYIYYGIIEILYIIPYFNLIVFKTITFRNTIPYNGCLPAIFKSLFSSCDECVSNINDFKPESECVLIVLDRVADVYSCEFCIGRIPEPEQKFQVNVPNGTFLGTCVIIEVNIPTIQFKLDQNVDINTCV